MRSRRLGFWIGLLLCAHGASAQSPPPASDHAIVEWPVYGGNLASQFY